ncbi:MAG: caspase family protein [Rhodobacteraceae bacterium]|nr:caspase family protein [Paracoccaceae bacterium]
MRRLLAGLSLAALLAAAPALAENRALIVGVSEYPNLEERFWLKGPENDARLIAEYLTSAAPVPFAPGNVIVLADGVEGGAEPTLAAIRAAFARLVAEVRPGDFVYVHFSGHGSQAPELVAGSELNGLDQIFLPRDVGKWDKAVGAVENALVDDEVGAFVAALRARGADVWVVFDSCHSATATRGVEDEEVRAREVLPAALGIPEEALEVATSRSIGDAVGAALDDPRARAEAPVGGAELAPGAGGGAGEGSLIAFFAAQTTEVTPEMRMPPGRPERIAHGVFTYTLFEVLAEYPGITYAQLAQEVLRRYAVRNLARTTPIFEGDLDGQVFGADGGGRVAQWPASREGEALTIPAGTLHGIGEGTILAILPSAADGLEAALGYAEVTRADTFGATATPVAHDGTAAVRVADLPRGVVLRQVSAGVDFTLAVALPAEGGAAAEAMRAAARLIAAGELAGPRVRFVEAGEAADIRLAVIAGSARPDAIWLLPGAGLVDAGQLAATPSVGTAGRSVEDLAAIVAENLRSMARATNLLKLGASVAGAGGVAGGVDVDLLLRPAGGRDIAPLDLASVPRLVPGDTVYARIENRLELAVDVNVLYIGADYSITHMWAGQLQPGELLSQQGLFRVSDTGFGRDRIVVVLTPARRQGMVENLAFLGQPELELTRDADAPALPPFAALLGEAGFGVTTRAAVPFADAVEGPAPAILQIDLDTVPAG